MGRTLKGQTCCLVVTRVQGWRLGTEIAQWTVNSAKSTQKASVTSTLGLVTVKFLQKNREMLKKVKTSPRSLDGTRLL